MIWVSSRRRPILSPPGLGKYAFLKRASKGPASITEPRSLALFLMVVITLQVIYVYIVCFKTTGVTIYPVNGNIHFSKSSIRRFTSMISGILWMVTSSAVNKTALMICKASFLAP
jgi:hypothetical protein